MDELTVVMKARAFARKANPTQIPAAIDAYANEVNAVIRPVSDLAPEEPGYSFPSGGQVFICVNSSDTPARQRFTACHEIAHIVLGLPSDHEGLRWWSYAKRPLNEIFCDVFAAEILLPVHLLKPIADRAEICFDTVSDLAERFEASDTATGSRFATIVKAPCGFVLSEQGKVRYTSRSAALRDANAWVPPRSDLPLGSVSQRVRAGDKCDGPEETDADIWFSDWNREGVLLEEARHLPKWDQTLTLLWFEDEDIPPARGRDMREEEEELGLKEFDRVLPWPGKSRRKN